VIDHLRKLDEAGLVESTTDDQRRKYFRIAQSLRLEVSVSPYGFGAKSAYPAKNSFDMASRCQHLSIEIPDDSGSSSDLADLAGEYGRLQDLDRELSLAQRWVQGRVEDTLAEIDERLGTESDSRFSRRCSTRWSRPTAHPRRSPTRSAPARRRWRTPSTSSPTWGSSPATAPLTWITTAFGSSRRLSPEENCSPDEHGFPHDRPLSEPFGALPGEVGA